MKTRNRTRSVLTALACIVALTMATPSMAALVITNGDFNDITDGDPAKPAGPGGGSIVDDNVSGWFDDTKSFASATHDDRNHGFVSNTTPYVLFADSTRPGDSGQLSYIYQNIGTRDAADATLQFDFEMAISSRGSATPIKVVLSLYQSALFAGIEGSTGYLPTAAVDEVLIDSVKTVTYVSHPGGANNATLESVTFDLASANTTDSLFLMLQTGTSSGFFQIDNVTATVAAIPEPSSLVLSIMGLLGLVGIRRRRNRS